MRIVCPNCSANYDVADNAIPTSGREVQCTNCEHAWLQEPALILADVEPQEEPAYFRSSRTEHQDTQPVEPHLPEEATNVEAPREEEAPKGDWAAVVAAAKATEAVVETAAEKAPSVAATSEPAKTEAAAPVSPDVVDTGLDPADQDDILSILRSEAAFSSLRKDEPAADPYAAQSQNAENLSREITEDHVYSPELSDGQEDALADLQKLDGLADEQSDAAVFDEPAPSIPELPNQSQAEQSTEEPTPIADEDGLIVPDLGLDDTPLSEDISESTEELIAQANAAIGEPIPEDSADDSRSISDVAAAAAGLAGAGAATIGATDNPFKKFGSRTKPAEQLSTEEAPAIAEDEAEKTDAERAQDALAKMGLKRGMTIPTDAPIPPEAFAPTGADIEPEAPRSRSKSGRDVFADVDSLGSTLEEEAEKEAIRAAEERAAEEEAASAERDAVTIKGSGKETTSMFWTGFWAACILVVVGTALYYFAPNLRERLPFASATLSGFETRVDDGRMVLQDLYSQGGTPSLSNFANNSIDAIMGRK